MHHPPITVRIPPIRQQVQFAPFFQRSVRVATHSRLFGATIAHLAKMASSVMRFVLQRGARTTSAGWAMSRALSTLPDHKLIRMPALSPTMEVGTIQEWKKKEGDAIEGGEVIAEIETDKATRSYEYNDDGFMAKVRMRSSD